MLRLYEFWPMLAIMKNILMDKQRPVREQLPDGQIYEYVPLGKHVVSAPAVCRGRPTFKYTRIEVAGVLGWLFAGNSWTNSSKVMAAVSRPRPFREAGALPAKALVQQVRGRVGGK